MNKLSTSNLLSFRSVSYSDTCFRRTASVALWVILGVGGLVILVGVITVIVVRSRRKHRYGGVSGEEEAA